MADFNLQQIPEGCPNTVTLTDAEGNPQFQVSLIDILRSGVETTWIYRIDNIGAERALSDWVLNIDFPCRELITECFVSPVFLTTTPDNEIPDLAPYDDCENEENTAAPLPCPEGTCPDAETTIDGRLIGFKFDNLGEEPQGELVEGFSQLFAFTIPQPPVAETGCVALKIGQGGQEGEAEFCGEICLPSCVICDNPCDCDEDVNTFNCEFTFPPNCFTLPEDVTTEDVLSGFCIGDPGPTTSTPCEGVAEIFVCDQTLVCCCEVLQWTRDVPIQVQLNLPKEGQCGGPVYECCYQEVTVTQNCFTCLDQTATFEDLTCDDVSIQINTITDNEDGTVTVNYSIIFLSGCIVEPVEESPVVGTPPGNNCPPPTSIPIRNIQVTNKPAVNNIKRRRR